MARVMLHELGDFLPGLSERLLESRGGEQIFFFFLTSLSMAGVDVLGLVADALVGRTKQQRRRFLANISAPASNSAWYVVV